MELKKMSGGMMADTDELTAVPEMVLENETFIGRGEDEAQSGTMPDMSKVKKSPTIQNEGKTVPAHRATNAKSTTNSDGNVQIVMSPPEGFFPGEGNAYVACAPEELGITPKNIPVGRTVCLVNGTWGADADFLSADLKEGKVAYGASGRVIGDGKNYGQVSKTLAAGETYDVKKGFYDDGKVVAKDLASQTTGNLDAAHMVSGQSGYSNGKKVSGSMVDRGAYQWAGRGGRSTFEDGFGSGTENGVKYYAFNNAPDGWYHNQGDDWSPELRLEQDIVRKHLGVSANKIAAGQTIADIAGTYTNDATAGASDLRSGKTAYVNGSKVSGSLPTLGATDKFVSAVMSQNTMWVRINPGIHDQNATSGYPEVYIPQADLANTIGLNSGVLTKDTTLLGVTGSKPYIHDCINWKILNNDVSFSASSYHISADDPGTFMANVSPSTVGSWVILRVWVGTSDSQDMSQWVTIGTNTYRKMILHVSDKYLTSSYVTFLLYRKSDGNMYYKAARGNTSGTYHITVKVLAGTSYDMSQWES